MVDVLLGGQLIEIVDSVEVANGHTNVLGELLHGGFGGRFQAEVPGRNDGEIIRWNSTLSEEF